MFLFILLGCFWQTASDTPFQTHVLVMANNWKVLFVAVLNIAWTSASAKSCRLWRRSRNQSEPWPSAARTRWPDPEPA